MFIDMCAQFKPRPSASPASNQSIPLHYIAAGEIENGELRHVGAGR